MTHLPTPGPLATTNLWVAASAAAGTKVLFLGYGPQDYPTGIAAAYEALVAALRAVADLAMHDPRTSAIPRSQWSGPQLDIAEHIPRLAADYATLAEWYRALEARPGAAPGGR